MNSPVAGAPELRPGAISDGLGQGLAQVSRAILDWLAKVFHGMPFSERSKPMSCTARRDEEAVYQIRVKGILDECWSDWFCGLTITPQANGETLLTGPVRDQAALYGLLVKVRDLGLPLLSVNRVDSLTNRRMP